MAAEMTSQPANGLQSSSGRGGTGFAGPLTAPLEEAASAVGVV